MACSTINAQCVNCQTVVSTPTCLKCTNTHYLTDATTCTICQDGVPNCLTCKEDGRGGAWCLTCGTQYFAQDDHSCALCSSRIAHCYDCD
jgi:hypothetical protein